MCDVCFYFSCVPAVLLSPEGASSSACWPPSQTSGPATVTSTTRPPCRRWSTPPRSGFTWVDCPTPKQPGRTSATDTTPSTRSPSAAGEEWQEIPRWGPRLFLLMAFWITATVNYLIWLMYLTTIKWYSVLNNDIFLEVFTIILIYVEESSYEAWFRFC